MADQEPGRRGARWMIGLLCVTLLWAFAVLIPAPFAIERPGPVVDALGDFPTQDGEEPVIVIVGAETFPTSGELNVLSVSILGSPQAPPNWFEVGGALLDPTRALVPLGDLYPEGVTTEDRTAAGVAMMRASQQRAIAAALGELGEPVSSRLRLAGVVEDGPSAGVLQEGDAILSVGGVPVRTTAELGAALAEGPEGIPLRIGIERQGAETEVSVLPVAPDPESAPMLGVIVYAEFEFPFEVELNLGDIGGPSAGMMFALAVFDALTPGALTGGLSISGTGTIDENGRIGAIGGLEQKLWGASRAGTDLLLVPMENCGDLPHRIPGDLRVAPVSTLEEAVAAIQIAAAGGTPPGLERCPAGKFVSSSQ